VQQFLFDILVYHLGFRSPALLTSSKRYLCRVRWVVTFASKNPGAIGLMNQYQNDGSMVACSLRIQVCPKKGITLITPTFLLKEWDWNPQSSSREGSGSLGVIFTMKRNHNEMSTIHGSSWIGRYTHTCSSHESFLCVFFCFSRFHDTTLPATNIAPENRPPQKGNY